MRTFVLISYEGVEPQLGTQKELTGILCEAGVIRNIEDINVECISEKEVVAIVAAVFDGKPFSYTRKKAVDVQSTPEQKATVVILERYKDIIATKNTTNLALQMLRDVAKAKAYKNDEQLISAVTILAHVQPDRHFEFENIRDADLWLKILEVIRNIYSSVCQEQ